MRKRFQLSSRVLIYLAWATATAGLVGSLYFSEVLHLPPCILCWFQRIFLYPQVIIFGVGLIRRDEHLPYYILPLSGLGLLTAIYHNLLYYRILPESIAPCQTGVSCTNRLIEWFGFVSIPFLSLLAFVFITSVMIIVIRRERAR